MLVCVITAVYFAFVGGHQLWLGVAFLAPLFKCFLQWTKIILHILTETERQWDYIYDIWNKSPTFYRIEMTNCNHLQMFLTVSI